MNSILLACGHCTPEPPAKWSKGVCVVCWHWKHTPKFRANLESGAKTVVPAKKSLPCVHVGERLTMIEIQAVGLNPRRSWHRCQIGMTANKKGVPGCACSCEGCGPKCKGYQS